VTVRVLVLGAGGHGQVVADALLCAAARGAEVEPVGFLDDDPALEGALPLGLRVRGPLAALAATPHDAVILGIGSNAVRRRIYLELAARGERFVSAIHPSATIGGGATVGSGTVVCAGAVINTGAQIGANVIINSGALVEHHNRVGDHAHIGPGARLGGDVRVGEGTLVGIGAIVLPQQQVGAWCVVGAGAVVLRTVGEGLTVAGVPARLLYDKRESDPQ
jgi:sugar O-acyltransferase (sialic acid O-acetyltransferase NeuD family)